MEGRRMTNQTTSLTVSESIDAFRDAFQKGIDSIVEASRIYVAALDENPRNADAFQDAFADSIPSSAWSGFEAVGRKWMHPKLLMGGMSDRKKATAVKRLPYSMQERIFSRERFPFLCADGETLQIDIMEATHDQIAQICDGSAIRNIASQRAYIEAQRAASATESTGAEVMPYTIKEGKVRFRRGVSLTRVEIKRLLQEM